MELAISLTATFGFDYFSPLSEASSFSAAESALSCFRRCRNRASTAIDGSFSKRRYSKAFAIITCYFNILVSRIFPKQHRGCCLYLTQRNFFGKSASAKCDAMAVVDTWNLERQATKREKRSLADEYEQQLSLGIFRL
ncbi:hypothetical protein TNCV_4820151 [Trichonephila clavipes]|nr:hypothetical protein TNCV_4820151 [Trichonephila clavipes]